MFIKMKACHKLFLTCICIFALLSSCSNTPGNSKKNIPATKGAELSADEQNTYQEALEALKAENAEKAIQPLNRIANSHPEHLGAWINLANAYVATSKINEAQNALTRAKAINPNLAENYNLQGLIEVNKGEYANAEKSYLQAIKLKGNYPSAHYNLALLYDIYYQDIDRAVTHYDRYLELGDGSDKKTISWVTELKQKIKRRNK
ncbi:MAG: tetratricopeptide repeat protein [Cellvibrio sp.]